VLAVDTGLANMQDKVVAAIQQISPKPIHFVIDTHVHRDHIDNNAKLRQIGVTIAGGDVARLDTDIREGAAIVAHQEVLNRLIKPDDGQPPALFAQLPTDTYFGDKKDLFFNDEAVRLFHPKNAHTDGDTIVFFRRSDVIGTGDIFTTTNYPIIDLARGGSIQGEIDALNQILGLVVPAGKEEGGTMIVPGHGRLCDAADVAYYRDMVTIVRDRIEDMRKKGMTLEQVKAAKLTRDYDGIYGRDAAVSTPDKFVEAVYRSLATR
jgi:cyclase